MKNKHIFYFDALRTIAILCVVLLHITGHLAEITNYTSLTIFSPSGIFETFMNNFTRIGVDLFFILSGALLLGRNSDIKSFLSKRLPRIIKPFLFWSLIFSAALLIASYTLSSFHYLGHNFLNIFYNTLMCDAPGSAVYWFFWTMLGVYLIMPIFNKWVLNADLSEIEYFLVIWIVSTIFDYTLMKSCPIKLTYFTSPFGLVLLGYYLRHTKRKIFSNVYIAVILTILPAALMLVYSLCVIDSNILFEFHRYSILPIAEAVGIFCLFKTSTYLNNPDKHVKTVVSSIAMCSYGMYLTHSQIIMIVRKVLHISFDFTITYLILFFTGFIMSWLLILLLSKIPIINDYVGVK